MSIPFPNAPLLHFILESLAFFIGIRIYYFEKRKITDFISDTNRLWILLGAMLGALIGSRVIALLENPDLFSSLNWKILYQNKTVAGGFFGGLFGVEFTKKRIGVTEASGDIYVIPIIIALIIGRIGCFGMGVLEPTYGIETTFFTGMPLGDGKLRHPIALYEIVYLAGMWCMMKGLPMRNFINGDRFKLFMVLYFFYRFLVEWIKPFHPLFMGLSIQHWIAIFIFVYYGRFLIRISKNSFNA